MYLPRTTSWISASASFPFTLTFQWVPCILEYSVATIKADICLCQVRQPTFRNMDIFSIMYFFSTFHSFSTSTSNFIVNLCLQCISSLTFMHWRKETNLVLDMHFKNKYLYSMFHISYYVITAIGSFWWDAPKNLQWETFRFAVARGLLFSQLSSTLLLF